MTVELPREKRRKIVLKGAEVISRITTMKESSSRSLSEHVAELKKRYSELKGTSFESIPEQAKIELVLLTLFESTKDALHDSSFHCFASLMADLDQLSAVQDGEEDQQSSSSKTTSHELLRPPSFFNSDSQDTTSSSSSSSSSSSPSTAVPEEIKVIVQPAPRVSNQIIINDVRCPKGWKRLADGSGYLNVLTNIHRKQHPPLSEGGVASETGVPSVRDLSTFLESFSTNTFNDWIQVNEIFFDSPCPTQSGMEDEIDRQQEGDLFNLLRDQLIDVFLLSSRFYFSSVAKYNDLSKTSLIEKLFRTQSEWIINWIDEKMATLPQVISKRFYSDASKDPQFKQCFINLCLAVFKAVVMVKVATVKCTFATDTIGVKILFDRECHTNVLPMNSSDPLFCHILFPGLVTQSNNEMVHPALVAK